MSEDKTKYETKASNADRFIGQVDAQVINFLPEDNKKDWTGNSNSIYKTLGASNHTDKHRQQQDYYATEPKAVELLLEVEQFNKNIWEPACGEGHIAKVLVKHGYSVKATDLVDRGYGEQKDFLFFNDTKFNGDIITNPPYAKAVEFVGKAIDTIPDGNKIAMFLKIQFLEGKQRKVLYQNHPPKVIYVSSSRLLCAKNAEFDKMIEGGGSAVAYAWFIWQKGYKGETIIKWIN
ncbi:MAG: hypothetical protein KDC68_08965 [Gelidibacter sp.]|nr:hypothetical protein [Gelidibacter sp.]